MTTLDWVRCSSCFSHPMSQANYCIFLTSCGHFICHSCYEKDTDKNGTTSKNSLSACLVCQKPCSLARLGEGSKLGKTILLYFSDPVSVLKKLSLAAEFQKSNYKRSVESHSKQQLVKKIEETKKRGEKLQQVQALLACNQGQLSHVLQHLRRKSSSAGLKTPSSSTPHTLGSTKPSHQTAPFESIMKSQHSTKQSMDQNSYSRHSTAQSNISQEPSTFLGLHTANSPIARSSTDMGLAPIRTTPRNSVSESHVASSIHHNKGKTHDHHAALSQLHQAYVRKQSLHHAAIV